VSSRNGANKAKVMCEDTHHGNNTWFLNKSGYIFKIQPKKCKKWVTLAGYKPNLPVNGATPSTQKRTRNKNNIAQSCAGT
jgi:hypothetical protein